MGAAVGEEGLRVEGFGFYDRGERAAAVRLPDSVGMADGTAWVLPQDRLEAHLEDQLLRSGIHVHWGHRLDEVQQDEEGVCAVVEEIGFNSVGYPFARTEETVAKVRRLRARFLIGTDGADSHVRQCLGIGVETFGTPRVYDMIECRMSTPPGSEARVTFLPGSIDGYWPLPGWGCRWSLEVSSGSEIQRAEAALRLTAGVSPADRLAALEQRIRIRAPWYEGGMSEWVWQAQVVFRRQVAAALGRGHVWMAGDAAHQANPLGMHSMNLGLVEAVDLARRMREFLADRATSETFLEYDESQRSSWRRWLGAETSLRMADGASDWVRAHRHQILMALPASGESLVQWAAQLGIQIS